MTKIRALYCGDRLEEFHEDNDGKFVKGITTLTRLTSLELDICLPATSLQGIAGLPMLEKLGLRVGDIANNASFYVKLPHKPGSRRPGRAQGGSHRPGSAPDVYFTCPAIACLSAAEFPWCQKLSFTFGGCHVQPH